MMYLTGLYASNMVLDRENLWLQLVNIASVVDNEGLLMRDFNNVEIPKDKKGDFLFLFLISEDLPIAYLHAALPKLSCKAFNLHGEGKG